MRIKQLVEEDFVNYKLPSMFIGMPTCNWKCCTEGGFDISVCQNSPLGACPVKEVRDLDLLLKFENNPITKAFVLGGLEPFDSYEDIFYFFEKKAYTGTPGEIVIYTGYYKDEVLDKIQDLQECFPKQKFVIKFGRYIPNKSSRYDEVLGVTLASDNQYAEVFNEN